MTAFSFEEGRDQPPLAVEGRHTLCNERGRGGWSRVSSLGGIDQTKQQQQHPVGGRGWWMARGKAGTFSVRFVAFSEVGEMAYLPPSRPSNTPCRPGRTRSLALLTRGGLALSFPLVWGPPCPISFHLGFTDLLWISRTSYLAINSILPNKSFLVYSPLRETEFCIQAISSERRQSVETGRGRSLPEKKEPVWHT